MADLMQDAAQWIADQIGNAAAHAVIYRPIGGQDITIQAAIGRQAFVAESGEVVLTDYEARDYLVKATDLPGLPQLGDQIIDDTSGQAVTFEVMSEPGGQHWRLADPFGVRLRIHTKRTATE